MIWEWNFSQSSPNPPVHRLESAHSQETILPWVAENLKSLEIKMLTNIIFGSTLVQGWVSNREFMGGGKSFYIKNSRPIMVWCSRSFRATNRWSYQLRKSQFKIAHYLSWCLDGRKCELQQSNARVCWFGKWSEALRAETIWPWSLRNLIIRLLRLIWGDKRGTSLDCLVQAYKVRGTLVRILYSNSTSPSLGFLLW